MKNDIALLMIRLGFGGMMLFSHGLPKLLNFSEKSATFFDPIGLGSPVALSLAIFAEVFCSAGVMLGVMTRWAAIPLVITMLVAAGLVHADDPWSKKEFPLLFAMAFSALMVSGGGALSIDRMRERQ